MAVLTAGDVVLYELDDGGVHASKVWGTGV